MSPKKEKALAAVLTYSTRKQAAEAAGISVRTLQNYFDDEEFQQRYKAAFSEIVEAATRDAQRAVAPAIACLRDIVENGDEAAPARISAAKGILEYALKLGEMTDVLSRLDTLEANLKDGGGYV